MNRESDVTAVVSGFVSALSCFRAPTILELFDAAIVVVTCLCGSDGAMELEGLWRHNYT